MTFIFSAIRTFGVLLLIASNCALVAVLMMAIMINNDRGRE